MNAKRKDERVEKQRERSCILNSNVFYVLSDVENDKNIILCNALLLSESVLGFLPASQLVWDGDDSRNKSYLLSHWYAGSFVFVTSTLAERERDGRIREWSRRRVMVDEDEKEESPWKKREKTVKREERERE
ncbi:hypothetical protein LSTR_LSTR005137 [Laodelphax striatellus]|uniref:Uncharacterized protein n=1 Tax=Laodelphax striatellus TaxID=195883 RepID=A0A482WPT9_LAOST|nr:hypothetical protein LSTR_LSTR005137 [Laodelphax striatellus]